MDLQFRISDPLSDIEIDTLYNFINLHYRNDDLFHLQYSIDLFKFFLRNIGTCIPLLLYEKSSLIGCVIGTVRKVILKAKEYRCLDIDFLCIKKERRNLRLTEKLIYKMQEEGLKSGCNMAFFTINKEINLFKQNIVCHKRAFHYKIKKNTSPVEDSVLKIYNGTLPDNRILQNLHKSLLQFYKRRFTVYDKKDLDELRESFMNSSFIHCLFDNGTYFCFYKLDLINENKKERHLYLYTYKVDTISPQCIKKYINQIAKCEGVSNFDYISIIDPFGFNEKDYNFIGFGKGSGSLYYYLPTLTGSINPKDISLVPI